MCFLHLLKIHFNTKSWFLWNFYTSVYDLKWLFCQSLKTFLPDPVCVQCIVLSRNRCSNLCKHCKGDIKMVI